MQQDNIAKYYNKKKNRDEFDVFFHHPPDV